MQFSLTKKTLHLKKGNGENRNENPFKCRHAVRFAQHGRCYVSWLYLSTCSTRRQHRLIWHCTWWPVNETAVWFMNQTKVVCYLITLSLRRGRTMFTVLLMGVNTGCGWPCKVTVLRPFRHFKLESRDAQPTFITAPCFICLQILSGRDPGINKWGFRPTVLHWIHSKILNGPKPDSCGTSSATLLYGSAVQWSQSTAPHPQVYRLPVVTGAARPRNRGSILCRFKRFYLVTKG